MHPSPIGEWVQRCWDAIPEHIPHVDVGEFVAMPNHPAVAGQVVHGIVVIRERLVIPVGGHHDRPVVPIDHVRPGITTGHDRPDTTPDPNASERIGTLDAMNDVPYDGTANAPHTQIRADHDRPLRPPTPPANATDRPMPIVPVGSLGRIVRAYKSAVTRMAYRDGLLPHGTPVWQRNYWDRVIRDDGEHERIAKYIRDNPINWKEDRFNR